MNISCGIIGLPNVGKSSLFNLLTKLNVKSNNYPFCTIDPNVGTSPVPDMRQDEINKISQSKKIVSTKIKFIDIAGLVKGASLGEGLGNKFLANIRETTAIIHVVRCFKNNGIIHINNDIDPIKDMETINTELMLSDIDQIKRILDKKNKKRLYDNEQMIFLKKLYVHINKGNNIASYPDINKYKLFLKELQLLTIKPVLYVANTDHESDNCNASRMKRYLEGQDIKVLTMKIKNDDHLLGEQITILNKLVKETYNLLNLITFFSVGPNEIKAWSIKQGTSALDAAKKIHSDIKRGFIKAEVISYKDFIKYKGEAGVRKIGRCRLEGKKYTVQDGDIINFRFNV